VTLAFSPRSAAFVTGYRAIARLHRGDLCDLYDSWSEERQARCVLKVLRPDRRAYAADRRRVVTEGELLLSLTHPHIVRAYEVHEDPVPFIVLEANIGPTLADLIERGPLLVREIARVATQASSALSYLHRRGYWNLDLRSSNVTYERGHTKLLDLSTLRRPNPNERHEADDIRGLGCLLYKAATGRAPFAQDGTRAEMPPPFQKRGRLLPATGSIIMRCLSPVPNDRPSIAEVAQVFAPLI